MRTVPRTPEPGSKTFRAASAAPGRLLPLGQAPPQLAALRPHPWASHATCWPSAALPTSGRPALRAPSGTCPATRSDGLTVLKAPASGKRPAQGGT